jgi:hypothetical protein
VEVVRECDPAVLPSTRWLDHDQLIPWLTLRDKFESVLSVYFRSRKALDPAYQMYFATLFNESLYVEHSFLSSVMALETYDGQKRPCRYVSDSTWETVKATLESAIPQDTDPSLRRALKAKMNWGNDYSLRDRLKSLANDWSGLFGAFQIPPDEWANMVVDARNGLVHESRLHNGKVDAAGGLYWLTQSLRVFIEALLLAEIGFERTDAIGLIKSSNRFSQLKGKWFAPGVQTRQMPGT